MEARQMKKCLVFAFLALGVLLFSGSLYLMLAGAPRMVGVLTPLGGLALIAGWCTVAIALGGRVSAGHNA